MCLLGTRLGGHQNLVDRPLDFACDIDLVGAWGDPCFIGQPPAFGDQRPQLFVRNRFGELTLAVRLTRRDMIQCRVELLFGDLFFIDSSSDSLHAIWACCFSSADRPDGSTYFTDAA